MKPNHILRAMSLLALLISFLPASHAGALASSAPPPVDMFQLPWDLGIAWVALDGIDNGSKRPATSSHNYRLGGAIDFAPRANMVTGENTSNFWVTAAAAGTVIETSTCYLTLLHDSGWITQYQFLGNIQVQLGDVVSRNQRLAVIADGVRYKYCPGYQEINVPHLHFILRPTTAGATFAGWHVNYDSFFNRTTFRKGLISVGLFKPLLNVMDAAATPTPTASQTPTGGATGTPTDLPSSTPTLVGPYVSTTVDSTSVQIGETALATVSLNNVPPEGYTSAEFTCIYDPMLVEVSNITIAGLFGADPATAINDPQNGSFIVAIAGSQGNTATTSGPVFTFESEGVQVGQTSLECEARVSQGSNVLTEIPSVGTSLTVLGNEPTSTQTPVGSPVPTETPTPITLTPVESPTPVESSTSPPVEPPPATFTPTATQTSPTNDWLTFTNITYGFQFKYPPGGEIVPGNTDNLARIDLPFVAGTNLTEKYLQVTVVENADPCRSPVAAASMTESSETVTINGITFLKETGGDAGAGNLYQFVAYSTSMNNACVSLSFVLHSLNPGNFTTPPPVFDYDAESAVFEQIIETYMWLTSGPTATPTSSTPSGSSTPTPVGSPTATATQPVTPTVTGTVQPGGVLNGQVFASKPVTINVFDAGNNLVGAGTVNEDGTFSLGSASGTNTVIASASGFLRAQTTVTISDGSSITLPTISLLAGDIDGNNVIDQFDAMTIGMSYNSADPPAADLNNDGTINVLDLELLASNYREMGPTAWE